MSRATQGNNWIREKKPGLRRLRIQAAVLAVVLVLSLVVDPVAALAAEVTKGSKPEATSQKAVENTYALVVSTGASPGTQVEFFNIAYEMQGGAQRTTQVILQQGQAFPGDAQTSQKLVESVGNTAKATIDNVRTSVGYSIGVESSIHTPLRTNTVDTYLFTTDAPIVSVKDISFYATGKGSWSCQSMRIYQVDALYGTNLAGYFSNQNMTEFRGTLLSKAVMRAGRNTFSWTGDKMFSTNTGKSTVADFLLNSKIAETELRYDSAKQNNYFFELAFADIHGAGIETLFNKDAKVSLSAMGIYEALSLEISYFDIYQQPRKVIMPVVSNTISWALKNGVQNSDCVDGFAQQGESLGFAGKLPDFKQVNSYRLVYGNEAAVKEAQIQYTGQKAAEHKAAVDAQKDPATRDDIRLQYLAIYTLDKSAKAKIQDGCLRYDLGVTPSVVHVSSQQTISPGATIEGRFTDYASDMDLATTDYSNAYLVTVTTDNMPGAGTASDVFLKFHYRNAEKQELWSSPYSLRQASQNYYGKTSATDPGLMYKMNMSAGQSLNFIITLKDLSTFLDFTVTLADGSTDDWQLKHIEIQKINSLGHRSIALKEWSAGSFDIDRAVTRDIDGTIRASKDVTTLIQPNQPANIPLGKTDTVVDDKEQEETSWDKQRYSLTYEEACLNLGFARARHAYEITVNVADDLMTSTNNGDCGSKNHFYFQLVFKDGASAYVLANQQLSGDGFRAKYAESFNISVNQNYGELVAVNIIPDDITSNSDAYDKLKINSIAVRYINTDGLSKQWVIRDVGWLAINYREDADAGKNETTTQDEGQLAQSFRVDFSSNVMNMQMSISTGSYEGQAQFAGQMRGTLAYYDTAGEYRTKSIDVVQAIYEYINKKAVYTEEDHTGTVKTERNAITDPAYMFRENTTDRFIMGVGDAAELISFTLDITGSQSTIWRVTGISASLIDQDGPLILNNSNEYQRNNVVRDVAQNADTSQIYELTSNLNGSTSKEIRFGENKIEIIKEGEDGETGKETATITRVPYTSNDILNIFVYPSAAGREAAYTLNAMLQYNTVFGVSMQTIAPDLQRSADGAYFYHKGMAASNMVTLGTLTMSASNVNSVIVNYLDHAIIQQVRSGVVVQTYYMNFGASNTTMPISVTASNWTRPPADEQVVELKLGQGMEPVALIEQKQDIAVALQYTSTLMEDDTALVSPYIYLTDQEYRSIAAGNTVKLTFHQPFVKDVTKLSVAGLGDVNVPVDQAVVTSYTGATKEVLSRTSWSSFNDAIQANAQGAVMEAQSGGMADKNALTTLYMTFSNEQGKGDLASYPTGAVRLRVEYSDSTNALRVAEYPDLRNHQLGGAVAEDAPMQIAVMLQGVKEIRRIVLEPYDSDAGRTAEWEIKWLTMSMDSPTQAFNYKKGLNLLITEGAPKSILLAPVVLNVTATSTSAAGSVTTVSTQNGSIGMLVDSGRVVRLTPQMSNSSAGITTKVEQVESLGTSTVRRVVDNLLSTEDADLVFKTPENTTDSKISYCVTLASSEMPEVQVEVMITVLPAPKKVEEPIAEIPLGGGSPSEGTSSDAGGGSGSTDSGSGGGSGSTDSGSGGGSGSTNSGSGGGSGSTNSGSGGGSTDSGSGGTP